VSPQDGQAARQRQALAAQRLLGSPYLDLLVISGGLPLWWFLGVDQFAYPVLLAFPAAKLLLRRRSVWLSPTLVALGAFLLVFCASGFFIVETDRYATFVKNLSTYVTAALLLIVVPGTVHDWPRAKRVMAVLLAAMAVSGVLGILAVTGVLRPEFRTLGGMLLPASLADTALGQNISVRSLGWTSWFSGLGSYFRVRGTFLWPTSYAPVLVMTIPVAMLFVRRSRNVFVSALLLVLALVLSVNLVFTTGRVALVALLAGLAYWYFVGRVGAGNLVRIVAVVVASLVAAGAMLIEPTALDVKGQVETLALARGTGSPTARLTIYRSTLEGFMQRPLLGWGTERTIVGVADGFIYPAGSHSYFLGVLYRHGVVGLAFFVMLWVAIWKTTAREPSSPGSSAGARSSGPEDLMAVGRGIVVSALLMSLTLAFDLDASLMFVWWLIVGLLVAVKRVITAAAVREAPGGRDG